MAWGTASGEHFLASNPASTLAASVSTPAAHAALTGGGLDGSVFDTGGACINVNAQKYRNIGTWDPVANTGDASTAINQSLTDGAGLIPVYAPGPNYRCPNAITAITNGTIFEGAGKSSISGNPTKLDFSAIAGGTTAIGMAGLSDVVLGDFYITGRAAGAADEIQTSGSSRRLTLRRIIINTHTTGVGVDLGVGGSLIQSVVDGVTVTGVGNGTGIQVSGASTATTLLGCYVTAMSIGYLLLGTYLAGVGCASDANTLYGWVFQNAKAVGLLACGAENSNRTAFHCTGADGVALIACRAVTSNTNGSGIYPSFLSVNDGSDNIVCIACHDTTPTAGTTNSVKNWNGATGSNTWFIACNFALPLAAGINRYGTLLARANPVYGATVTINADAGRWHTVTVTDGNAWTLAAPTNPWDGREIVIEVFNNTGGAISNPGTNAAFALAGAAAFVAPGTTKRRVIAFTYQSTAAKWIEQYRTTADT